MYTNFEKFIRKIMLSHLKTENLDEAYSSNGVKRSEMSFKILLLLYIYNYAVS